MAAQRRRHLIGVAAIAVLVLSVPLFTPTLRSAALRAAGRLLVADGPPVAHADAIVVAVGAGSAGALEAADLVAEGVSRRVVVVAEPPDPIAAEFIRRGLGYEQLGDATVSTLRALGVSDVEKVPRGVAGTEDEAVLLPRWCADRGLRSVVVVTTADHSRRLARVLRRSQHPGVMFTVRAARQSIFQPGNWWTSRNGLRIGIVEFEKLLLDAVRHPLA